MKCEKKVVTLHPLMRKRDNIFLSDVVRNTTKLLSANVLAQVVGLLIYPLLTRLYSHDDFGLLSLFVSMGGVLALVSTAEYQYSIVLPKDEKTAVGAWHMGGIILCCVSLLVALSIPFAPQIAALFKAPTLTQWYWALPIYVFLMGLWALLNYWYNRHKQFGKIGTYQVSQSLVGAGAKAGFGAAGFTSGGLIVSAVLAPLTAIGLNILTSLRSLIPLRTFDKKATLEAARTYRNFPCFSLPRALVNNVSGNLGVWLLTPAFGLTSVGFFGMAITLAFRPLNVICNSIYQVLYQRTSERVQQQQSIRHIFRQLLTKTALIVGVAFLALYFILPTLCGWLLSEGWEETGEIIRLFLPWLFFSMLVAPICFLADVFGKQKIGLVFEVLLVTARAAGLLLGIWKQDFHLAVLAYSLSSALVICAQLVWYLSLVRRYESTLS